MPTYTYHCRCCENVFEAVQSIKDVPIVECPRCHVCTGNRQIVAAAAFVLKGDGWAKDNYSKKAGS